MRTTRIFFMVMAWVLVFAVGCRKNAVDTMAFKSALNSFYSGRQNCLWTVPVKLPAQADTSNDEQTRSYDALTDVGLLTRKAEEKKQFLIGSKQVNDYDLSDKGRSLWTPDTTQPGYGNFCYGHLEVTSIDGYTPADDTGTRYNVTYHLGVGNPKDWATNAEIKTAFPKVWAETSGQQMATASLVKSGDGWQVQNVQPGPAPTNPMP
jgi:hypothetical protein